MSDNERELCSFYMKIGSCRHGSKCSRLHVPPTSSQVVLLKNLCRFVDFANCSTSTSDDVEQQFEELYDEIYSDIFRRYGEVLEMHILENLAEHLIGNVYVKFRRKDDVEKAVEELNRRWFNGRPIYAELCPVTDFRDAYCRQHENDECTRGGFCNFMHIRPISQTFKKSLQKRLTDEHVQKRNWYDQDGLLRSGEESDSSLDSDASVPKRYRIDRSLSSSTTSQESFDEKQDLTDESRSSTPKAFRIDRYVSGDELEMSEEEIEIVHKKKQIMWFCVKKTTNKIDFSRRSNWERIRFKVLDTDDPWDEKKEQNFIFSLL